MMNIMGPGAFLQLELFSYNLFPEVKYMEYWHVHFKNH